ncbi:hypothetical protein TNCV_5030481 [Trichonephila clavipes]|nr:hypothetical protein TNCV_5030481 [Trichonephila clavipes]
MDRNMRAAVFSPIRNKSFEDHKQSDELPACNISKYLKGPAAFKENLKKTSADVTSKKNKKPSGSSLQNKSLDKASEHKTSLGWLVNRATKKNSPLKDLIGRVAIKLFSPSLNSVRITMVPIRIWECQSLDQSLLYSEVGRVPTYLEISLMPIPH